MKAIFFLILFSTLIIAQRRTMVDVNNSSTDTLSSSATFTGVAFNAVTGGRWSSLSVSAYHNHAAGVNGTLRIRFSTDGTNWAETNDYTIATDTETEPVVLPILHQFYQVLFINGAELQTEFRLETILYENDMSVGQILEDSTLSTSTAITSTVNPVGNSTDSTFVVSVTGSATQFASHACRVAIFTNNTPGEIAYMGSSGNVSTANGFQLGYHDSIILSIANTNQFYHISDGTTLSISVVYLN